MIDGELTPTELEYFRRDGQKSLFYLAFLDTPVVFKARVNQSFSSRDKVLQITYDDPAGDYSLVLPGMTCWVGSSDGAYDLGQVRVRKAPTSDTLYIGETSEIDWDDELYLTVVDDFGPWVKTPDANSSNVIFMDGDIAYAAQNKNMKPFPMIGSDRIVRLVGESVSVAFDASASWCPGSTIASHLFTAPGAAAASGLDTATPLIDYDVPGTYRIDYQATADNGEISITHRKVLVWDQAHAPLSFDPANQAASDFVLDMPPMGSYDRGGWQFSVRMLNQADFTHVHDRQRAILFARDFYGDTEISIGPLAGAENIVASGWIDGESIVTNTRGGAVSFDIQGLHFWLDMLTGPTFGLANVHVDPANWGQMRGLTVDKALAFYLTQFTTVSLFADVRLTGDTRLAPSFSPAIGSVWLQLNLLAAHILAKACTDRCGRLFIEIDSQAMNPTDRASIPQVFEILKSDRATVTAQRQVTRAISSLQISSTVMAMESAAPSIVYSMSGHIPGRFGRINPVRDGFLASDQAHANLLCGLLQGKLNNEYPAVDVELGSSCRAVDICPNQYISVPLDESSSPRRLAFSGRLIARNIQMKRSAKSFWTATVTGEAETFPALSINGDIPNSGALPSFPPIGKIPAFPLVSLAPAFPTPPAPGSEVHGLYVLLGGQGVWYTVTFSDTTPTWLSKNAGAPGDLGILAAMDIDKLGGILYVMARHGMWAGHLGDPNLVQIIDEDWLRTEFPLGGDLPGDANNHISSFGVNRLAANSVLLTAGSGYLGTKIAAVFIGSYTRFLRKTNINWAAMDGGTGSDSTDFWNNEWLVTDSGFIWRDTFTKYNADASVIKAQKIFTITPGIGAWHIRAGNTPVIYTMNVYTKKLIYSPDNLTDMTLIEVRDFVIEVFPACDATGQYLMTVRSGTNTLEKSTDYGNTWGVISTLPGGMTVTHIVCIDANKWIVFGHGIVPYAPMVEYTEDAGLTWISKVGDLATYVPANPAGTYKAMVI